MKTFVFITSYAPSLINFRATLIARLNELGFRVLAVAPEFPESVKNRLYELNVQSIVAPIRRNGLNPIHDIWSLIYLTFLLVKLRPDITLSYFIKPVIYGSIAAFLARVPKRFAMVEGLGYIFTESSASINKKKFLQRLVARMYWVGFFCSTKVIFLNRDDQSFFLDTHILAAEKAFLLGGIGVDLVDWKMPPPLCPPFTFLMVARLLKEKGVVEFSSAANIVKKHYPTARFVLLGGLDPGPSAIDIHVLEEWVREGVLEWCGHASVKPWMEVSSVFVLPSYREGVPVSTQEAMAAGRPVITTDVPGCRETVVNEHNGFLVQPYDADALANKIMFFIENPEAVKLMGANSRALAELRFDVHKANSRLLDEILG